MSEDIVERLREYAEEWQIDRSAIDSAADEIIRLRALVEASVVLAQPGALTVNCVRGTVLCQEIERLRARVEVLERALHGIAEFCEEGDRRTFLAVANTARAALEAKP